MPARSAALVVRRRWRSAVTEHFPASAPKSPQPMWTPSPAALAQELPPSAPRWSPSAPRSPPGPARCRRLAASAAALQRGPVPLVQRRRRWGSCSASVARQPSQPAQGPSPPSAPSPVARRLAAWRASAPLPAAARTSFRELHARTACWRTPGERHGTGLPRQVRTPGPTSTGQSRRTENGIRGAWSSEFRLRRASAKAFESSGRGVY